MSDHPSDSELADMGDAEIANEDYPLATPAPPPKLPLPPNLRDAMRKAVEEEKPAEPPPLQRFQFTIRDMLILTAVVAFLMGLIVSINRGLSVYLMYSIFFLVMIVAWFAHGLWKAGYWQKPEPLEEEQPTNAHDEQSEEIDTRPPIKSMAEPMPYSVIDVFLLVTAFAFLMSLCTLLPGEHKLVNAAGIAGLCSLAGLVFFAMSESRHPIFIMFWWLMFLMYLLTSAAVMVMG
jgi:Ca2+/Na+ antiporter